MEKQSKEIIEKMAIAALTAAVECPEAYPELMAVIEEGDKWTDQRR